MRDETGGDDPGDEGGDRGAEIGALKTKKRGVKGCNHRIVFEKKETILCDMFPCVWRANAF